MANVDGAEMKTPAGRKRVRAGKPKARSGCRTCKMRHVKCDETKPHCLRCQRYGATCEGYPDLFRKRPFVRFIHGEGLPPILPKPADVLFQSEKEYRYFRLFCERMAPQLDGIIPSNLWSRLILQVGDYNAAIRHGIIAMAALDVTSKVARMNNQKPTTPDIEGHHHYALQQYNLAIRNMRNSLSKGEQDLATTLITCLIIIYFETFQGNHEGAFAHITTGVRIISEQFSKTGNLHQKYTEGISSAVLSSVDDDLMRAFVRLDIQAMSFVHEQVIGFKLDAHAAATAGLSGMPTRFRSLKEARNYLELILMYILKLISSVMPEDTDDGDIWSQSCHNIVASLGDRTLYYLTAIHRWHDAFQPLLTEARTYQGRSNFLGATNLIYQYMQIWFALEILPCNGAPREMKDFMPFFREMVTLGRRILQHPDANPNGCLFTMDFPIIPSLYMVGTRCPHSGVRREAIDILLSMRRRERLWDGSTAGKLAQKIMCIEEENIEGEYVPEDMRITRMGLKFDMKTRTVIATGMMPRKGRMEPILVKEDLHW